MAEFPFDFADYTVLDTLGKGGMAKVYLAERKIIGLKVALKVLFPEYAEERAVADRFLSEARTTSQMTDPNIVRIFDYGVVQGQPYIALEYIDGWSLDVWLKQNGPLPLPVAVIIARDVCRALEHAHVQRNIIHRDLKPGNIILSREGVVKLTDFGLAKALDRGPDDPSPATQFGQVLGTRPYMSPEQTTGQVLEGDAGKLSDVFSMGIVCYQLLGGERPFRGASDSAIARAIQELEPMPLGELNPLVPSDVAGMVRRMLAKVPADRIGISQALDVLEGALDRLDVRRDRAQMREYVLDPEATRQRLRDADVKSGLDRAVQAVKLGAEGRDVASAELRRVLYLDAANSEAQALLDRIEEDRRAEALRDTAVSKLKTDPGLMATVVDARGEDLMVAPADGKQPPSSPAQRERAGAKRPDRPSPPPSLPQPPVREVRAPATPAPAPPLHKRGTRKAPTPLPQVERPPGPNIRWIVVPTLVVAAAAAVLLWWKLSPAPSPVPEPPQEREEEVEPPPAPQSLGSIQVSTEPSGAVVTLLAYSVARPSPATFDSVPAGVCSLRVVRRGWAQSDTAVLVLTNSRSEVRIVLHRAVEPPVRALFRTPVRADSVLVDGVPAAALDTALFSIDVAAGLHQVLVKARGRENAVTAVTVAEGSRMTPVRVGVGAFLRQQVANNGGSSAVRTEEPLPPPHDGPTETFWIECRPNCTGLIVGGGHDTLKLNAFSGRRSMTLPEGRYDITLRSPGFGDTRFENFRTFAWKHDRELKADFVSGSGVLRVEGPRNGLAVYLNGARRPGCLTPCNVELRPGVYTVDLRDDKGVIVAGPQTAIIRNSTAPVRVSF